jgi:hypothetical protein
MAVVRARPDGEVLPGIFSKPSSVFISGASRSLLKWFAFAALSPYGSRVYWTDVRLPKEILDPLDPMTIHAIPEDSLYVLHPQELGPDQVGARQAEAAAATMIRTEGQSSSLEGLIEFIRMPSHAQKLISSTGSTTVPPILVTANAHRLAAMYTEEQVVPLMRTLLESGTCQVALWADAPTAHKSIFDVILHVEGSGSADWRNATVQCEKGVSSGPLASPKPHRFSEIDEVSTILEKSVPVRPKGRA